MFLDSSTTPLASLTSKAALMILPSGSVEPEPSMVTFWPLSTSVGLTSSLQTGGLFSQTVTVPSQALEEQKPSPLWLTLLKV
ncbi:MAG: hypothetical protein BWY86_00267 [Candidatus Aminicenantes bacterium ADurb.Bin508]|nr:MAG: hypothetical protein BWY86_00267 [Candidatus Aminicenantes bacterium ADurb.Bin508]